MAPNRFLSGRIDPILGLVFLESWFIGLALRFSMPMAVADRDSLSGGTFIAPMAFRTTGLFPFKSEPVKTSRGIMILSSHVCRCCK